MEVTPLATTPAPPAGLLPPPNCQRTNDQCRITITQTVQKPQINQWSAVYDGNGLMVGGDPNIYIRTATCQTCRQTWSVTVKPGSEYWAPILAAEDQDVGTD